MTSISLDWIIPKSKQYTVLVEEHICVLVLLQNKVLFLTIRENGQFHKKMWPTNRKKIEYRGNRVMENRKSKLLFLKIDNLIVVWLRDELSLSTSKTLNLDKKNMWCSLHRTHEASTS
jgi:hypothetical protein